MERRIFLAIFLSVVVLYAYQAVFLPPPPPPEPAPQQANRTQAEAPQPRREQSAPVVPQPATSARPVVTEAGEREIVLDTETVRAVFTNRGGRIKQWFLKGYAQDAEGRPVNLVPTSVPADQPLPFSLRVDEGALTPVLNNSLYRVTQGDNAVTFEFEDSTGLVVRKQFTLDPKRYLITFTAEVRQGERALNPYVQWGPGLGEIGASSGGGSFFTGNYVQPPQAIFHDGNDVERIAATTVGSGAVHERSFRFVGVDDHYFIAAAVNPGQARVEYRTITVPAANESETERAFVAHTYRFPQAPRDVKFFFGPKAIGTLESVDAEFVRSIYFGFFDWLAVPLLGALQWVYRFIGNYGWAIIILTVLINLAIFPLRHKSVVSMRKMQELQPQLKAIQDRYADLKVTDPARQKMNTEVMNLYREKGVNPASGCIPMLLTMPVLIAFYEFLSVSIELRGAPFALWIQDLSRPDPYYVTPLLMAGTMFWQQKITPTSADPTQQRIMLMMPLMFTVMFLSAPSGLVLYWFVSNLWAIGQQYFTNWLLGPLPQFAARPAAERRLKSAGSGKTVGAKK